MATAKVGVALTRCDPAWAEQCATITVALAALEAIFTRRSTSAENLAEVPRLHADASWRDCVARSIVFANSPLALPVHANLAPKVESSLWLSGTALIADTHTHAAATGTPVMVIAYDLFVADAAVHMLSCLRWW